MKKIRLINIYVFLSLLAFASCNKDDSIIHYPNANINGIDDQALFNAIEKANSTKGEDIGKMLRSESVSTTLGNISFDQYGDVVGSGFAIYQVQNGEFTAVDW